METQIGRLRPLLANKRNVAILLVGLSVLAGSLLPLLGPLSSALILALALMILALALPQWIPLYLFGTSVLQPIVLRMIPSTTDLWVAIKRLDEFSLALLLPMALARHLARGTAMLPRRAIWGLAILFAIGGIGSLGQGTSPRLVVLDAFLLTKGFLVFVIVSAFVPDERTLRTTIRVLLGVAIAAAAVGLAEMVAPGLIRSLIPFERSGLRLGRVAMVSLFDNEGQAGWFFAFCASACIGFYQVYRTKGLLGLVALFSVCALLTLRRKPIGGLLLVVLVSALLTKQVAGKLRVALVLGLLVIAIAFAFGDTIALVWSEGYETYVEVRDPTTVARTAMYVASYRIAVDHFPLGVGFGLFGGYVSQLHYSPVYQSYGLSAIWGLSPNYNRFMLDAFWPHILGQFGFFGLIGFLLALSAMWWPLVRAHRRRRDPHVRALTAAAVLTFIEGFVESTAAATFEATLSSFFLFGLAAVVYAMLREQDARVA
jgi:hypothetical protein